MNKSLVINALEQLPVEFTLKELNERLLIVEKINIALQEVEAGDIIEQDKVKGIINNDRNKLV